MLAMNLLNVLLNVLILRCLGMNQRSISKSEWVLRAVFLQVWNKCDAILSGLFQINNILTGHVSISGDEYIRLSLGASLDSMPPWKFFCWVSWQKVTTLPSLFHLLIKERHRNWWRNSRAWKTKCVDRWYQAHWRRTRGRTWLPVDLKKFWTNPPDWWLFVFCGPWCSNLSHFL